MATDGSILETYGSQTLYDERMEKRIRSFDWSSSPLGPFETWPQSLRTVVNILLTSRYPMWMGWGPELTFLYNDAYRPTLGIKHPWALGAPAREVWAEIWDDIGPRIDTVLSTGVATYDQGLLLFLERSGFPEETYHTFSYSPLTGEDGRVTGMLCVVMEETERVIGERRMALLRELASQLAASNTQQDFLAAVKERAGAYTRDLPFMLLYLFDRDGSDDARLACATGIQEGHPAAPSLIRDAQDLPWPAGEVLSNGGPILIPDLSDRIAGQLPWGAWDRPAEQAAIVPIKQQGQERPAGFLVAALNPYRRYDEAYAGFVDLLAGQVASGLANARAYDAARERAEALAEIDRAKTTFFTNVSHEFRTPLTLMLSPLEELLARPARGDDGDRELIGLIHRNGLRLQKLVNTLLDFSRIEAGRLRAVYEPVDLATMTAELSSNFRSAMERAGLDFTVHCEPLPEPILVDREMWEKIVLNLLSNALKFTFRGSVNVTLKAADNGVHLVVADTGTGIPENELPNVFDRFHRAEGARARTIEGTGIGLALVQELVKLHGGWIRVNSEVDKGTVFTVFLPAGTEHLPKEQIHASRNFEASSAVGLYVDEAARWLRVDTSSEASGARARILLAEDNADMRDYIGRLLGRQYEVIRASNGQEALQAAIEERPDLVLSDIMMPELDGFGLLKELRARDETKAVPVILLSARAGEESCIEGLSSGADDYLTKPFTARELYARVGLHLAIQARRQDAEEELRRSYAELSRANTDLEQFAYSASHDLQEPLRQVAIYSQLLQVKYSTKLGPEAEEYIAFCIAGAHQMETLIKDLLAYSQAGRPFRQELGRVDISDAIETVRSNLATAIAETGAEISCDPLPTVLAELMPIVQLFQNLISNAIKYHGSQPPRIRISASRLNRSWVFSVADNGIGIAPEYHEQVFGLFKRLHTRKDYPGTGIGLALCQKIVERYGGRIWVESELGNGATFRFSLPSELCP